MPHPQAVGNFRIGMAERYEIVIDFAKYRRASASCCATSGPDEQHATSTTPTSSWRSRSARRSRLANNEIPTDLNPNMSVMGLTEADRRARASFRFERERRPLDDQRHHLGGRRQQRLRVRRRQPRLRGRRDLGAREQVGRVVPPGPHPPRGLQDPRPQRPGRRCDTRRPEGRRLRRREREGPRDHEVREPERQYMMHCHNLVHEDHDMMTQFSVGENRPDNDPRLAAPCDNTAPTATSRTSPTSSRSRPRSARSAERLADESADLARLPAVGARAGPARPARWKAPPRDADRAPARRRLRQPPGRNPGTCRGRRSPRRSS